MTPCRAGPVAGCRSMRDRGTARQAVPTFEELQRRTLRLGRYQAEGECGGGVSGQGESRHPKERKNYRAVHDWRMFSHHPKESLSRNTRCYQENNDLRSGITSQVVERFRDAAATNGRSKRYKKRYQIVIRLPGEQWAAAGADQLVCCPCWRIQISRKTVISPRGGLAESLRLCISDCGSAAGDQWRLVSDSHTQVEDVGSDASGDAGASDGAGGRLERACDFVLEAMCPSDGC